MADNSDFDAIAQLLQRATALNELQSRGLVRRLLSQAGLSSAHVTPEQLAAVGRSLLSPALEKNGVEDKERVVTRWLDHCAAQRAQSASKTRTQASNTVEEVFARMGLR